MIIEEGEWELKDGTVVHAGQISASDDTVWALEGDNYNI